MSALNFNFPAEILNTIFSQVSEKDLPACCLVNHSFNIFSTPHLYRTFSVNLFYTTIWDEGYYDPKDLPPEVPSPRQNAISSIQKILSAETQRKNFILASVKRIEVYGIENYNEVHEWLEQYREIGQLYRFEVDISNLMIQVLAVASELKEFVWDIDLSPSTALITALQNHPSIKGVLFTTVCMHTEHQREYDLERPDDEYSAYAPSPAIRRRGRHPDPSLPFQNPIINPTRFQNLVVFGIHHIGSWEQVLAINSVIKACVKTLRCLSLRPCGLCECEYTNEGCIENGDILIKLLDISGTGELLKLRTLEVDHFELHKNAGKYIDFSALESLAINTFALGNLKDFWDTWVNRVDGSGPRNFPNLKQFRFVVTYDDEVPERPILALESFVDLVSRVPNGLQTFELQYNEGQPASDAELELWQAFLDSLRATSGKTLEALILFDQSRYAHGTSPKGIRNTILRNLAYNPSEWEKLETVLAEPIHNEWEAFLTSISTLPKLKTVLINEMQPLDKSNISRYDHIRISRNPTNRFGRQEPRKGSNAIFLENNMADAKLIARVAFPHAKTTKFIGIGVGHDVGRCFYRSTPETGVVQIDEDEFVLLTGEVEVVRWVSPEMGARVMSDLFNKDRLPRAQTVETQKAGVGIVERGGRRQMRRRIGGPEGMKEPGM